jgi:class II lanthipeptide synthase
MHRDLLDIAANVVPLGDSIQVDGTVHALTYGLNDSFGHSGDEASRVAAALYRRCYIRPTDAPRRRGIDAGAERDLKAALSRSNHSSHSWQPGWVLVELGEQSVAVRQDQVLFRAAREGVRAQTLTPGGACSVWLPSERFRASLGYYTFTGTTEDVRVGGQRARLYWHLTAEAAPRFVAEVSRVLNEHRIPFWAKTIDSPDGYIRADAAVIYLAATDLQAAAEALTDVYGGLRPLMRQPVPMFTKPVDHGLAIACDPHNGKSFGEAMCGHVAEGLVVAGSEASADAEQRLQAIVDVLASADIDPMHPYLYRSTDETSQHIGKFALNPKLGPVVASTAPMSLVATTANDLLRDASVCIADAVADHAIWDESHRMCGWVGRADLRSGEGRPSGLSHARAFAAEYYGGLAGVADFLAHAYAETGQSKFKDTANGAMRAAMRQLSLVDGQRPRQGFGLYAGVCGVLLTAARLQLQLQFDRDLSTRLPQYLEAAAAEDWSDSHDLISGQAGHILALLELSRYCESTACLERAVHVGFDLVDYITRAMCGTDLEQENRPISGMSHGAAGMGLALLQLHSATEKPEFLTAGRAAFRFEDEFYDPIEKNWPVLGIDPAQSDENGRPSFQVSWCYGAAGMALALGRASILDEARRDWYLQRATIALDTTRSALLERKPWHSQDVTLCHGLAGLVDSLWYGATELRLENFEEVAAASGTAIAEGWLAGRPWHSGVSCGGPNDSVMLGLSGVGLSLFRLRNSAITSPLLPVRV